MPRPNKSRVLLSVPLSPEQRAELERRAGKNPLSTYARACLFPANDNTPVRADRSRGTSPVKDHTALAAVLAKIGQAELTDSLRQIALLARFGALPITPETEAAIQKACREVAEIKALLMKALGVKEQ